MAPKQHSDLDSTHSPASDRLPHTAIENSWQHRALRSKAVRQFHRQYRQCFDTATGSQEQSKSSEILLTVPGETVYAIQYRRIRFKWYSGNDLDKSNLDKKAVWKIYNELR
jgi:hypothetical protein